jgi:ABC-type lipoprotein release transport system permease subunit
MGKTHQTTLEIMKLLYSYSKNHKALLFIVLLSAAINICFSLSDLITGKLMQIAVLESHSAMK